MCISDVYFLLSSLYFTHNFVHYLRMYLADNMSILLYWVTIIQMGHFFHSLQTHVTLDQHLECGAWFYSTKVSLLSHISQISTAISRINEPIPMHFSLWIQIWSWNSTIMILPCINKYKHTRYWFSYAWKKIAFEIQEFWVHGAVPLATFHCVTPPGAIYCCILN